MTCPSLIYCLGILILIPLSCQLLGAVNWVLTMKELYLTTSWDDGDPLDTKLGELLAKHNIKATFYIPCSNQEGSKVLSNSALQSLAREFEIGSHTLDHVPLDGNDIHEIRRQVTEGKAKLQDSLGKEVKGFCYPGGKNSAHARQIVADAGFYFARTTADFHTGLLADPYLMPTTIQFKPRGPQSFIFNFLKWGNWQNRLSLMIAGISHKET